MDLKTAYSLACNDPRPLLPGLKYPSDSQCLALKVFISINQLGLGWNHCSFMNSVKMGAGMKKKYELSTVCLWYPFWPLLLPLAFFFYNLRGLFSFWSLLPAPFLLGFLIPSSDPDLPTLLHWLGKLMWHVFYSFMLTRPCCSRLQSRSHYHFPNPSNNL